MNFHSSGEVPSLQQVGVPMDRVVKLARLGMVFEETRISEADGRRAPEATFSFLVDTPLGRANHECGFDVDILDGIIGDAERLSYEEFAVRFPKFGPYDN